MQLFRHPLGALVDVMQRLHGGAQGARYERIRHWLPAAQPQLSQIAAHLHRPPAMGAPVRVGPRLDEAPLLV